LDGTPVQTVHDPDRFIADLRQILSQGRKRIGLIVGAGAPMSIKVDGRGNLSDTGASLIPGVDDLTHIVIGHIQDETERTAATTLAQALGESTNIEQILSQVRLLERALGEVKIQGLNSQGYVKLGRSICDQIGKVVAVDPPKQRNAYHELVAWISGTLKGTLPDNLAGQWICCPFCGLAKPLLPVRQLDCRYDAA
jgi:hypothetical protein